MDGQRDVRDAIREEHERQRQEQARASDERETFSFGETPLELIAERMRTLPHGKLSAELNTEDVLIVLEALKDGKDAAVSLRVSILETLGIEEV